MQEIERVTAEIVNEPRLATNLLWPVDLQPNSEALDEFLEGQLAIRHKHS